MIGYVLRTKCFVVCVDEIDEKIFLISFLQNIGPIIDNIHLQGDSNDPKESVNCCAKLDRYIITD